MSEPSMLTAPRQKSVREIGSVARVEVSARDFNWRKPFEKGESYQAYGSASLIQLPFAPQDDKYYLLTAFHVVENAERIWSAFIDVSGELFETTIAGACPDIDIAILLVHNLPLEVKNRLKRFQFGDSDKVYAQQLVAAAGFPLAQNTVTIVQGVLSGRQDGNLQTTAPINSGNSGGPLFDYETGKILGVVVSGTRNAEAMNYAVPSRQILIHLKEMLSGFVHIPSFNIISFLSTPALLKSLGCPDEVRGAFVSFVQPDTPLYRAGLRSGDVLVSLTVNEYKQKYLVGLDNGVTVPWWTSPVTLQNIEQRLFIGEKIGFDYWSTQQKKLVNAQIALDQPDLQTIRYYYRQFEPVEFEDFGGIVAMELTENHLAYGEEEDSDSSSTWRQQFEFLTSQEPHKLYDPLLIVVDILPESTLRSVFEKTIGTCDVIVAVNDIPVKTLAEYKAALHKPKDGYVTWKTMDGVKTALEYEVAKQEK